MGGILSLQFTAHHPIAGVIAISTPYELPKDPRLPFVGIIAMFMPWMKQGPADFHNTEAAKDHICYPYFPTRSIIELKDLLREMKISLPRISTPALIIQSRQDKGVVPRNAEQILAALGSSDKRIFWVENSGHVIPREPERELAFQSIHEFIQRIVKTG